MEVKLAIASKTTATVRAILAIANSFPLQGRDDPSQGLATGTCRSFRGRAGSDGMFDSAAPVTAVLGRPESPETGWCASAPGPGTAAGDGGGVTVVGGDVEAGICGGAGTEPESNVPVASGFDSSES